MATRKEELTALLIPIREEIGNIEQAERLEAGRALVGKCFKYRNSYGGTDPKTMWWMYGVVVSMEADSYWPAAFFFQYDKQGKWEIEQRTFSGRLGGEYQEISSAELVKAWDAFEKSIPGLPLIARTGAK